MSDNPKAKSNPKAKKADSVKTESKQDKETDLKRMLNVGKEVTLSFGTFTVRELDIFTLISVVSDGLEAFVHLSSQDGASELEFIKAVAADKKFQAQVANLLALFCGAEDKTQFDKIKTTDFCKVIKAIKAVVDFDEIKESFFELGLQKYLNLSPTSTDDK